MIKYHLSGLRIAFSMLTILPFFKPKEFTPGLNGYAVAYYSLVGLTLGAITVGAFWALDGILPEYFLRTFLLCLYVVLYGGLHLDGLIDTIDGLFAPKERALDVMKEPTVGAMGVIFTFLFLALKLSAFISLKNFYLFLTIPALSRFGATLAIYFYCYVRQNGMGYLAKQEFTLSLLLFASFYTFIIGFLIDGFSFLVLFITMIIITFIVSAFLNKKFGGLSGDMYGAIIELNELALLSVFLINQGTA